MSQLAIAFDGDATTFEPASTLKGRALWLLDDDPEAVEVRLFWHTQGKGDRDLGVVAVERFDAPGRVGEQAFAMQLPDRPWSCSGKLISIVWSLEIVSLPDEAVQRFDVTIAPGGREVMLRGPKA